MSTHQYHDKLILASDLGYKLRNAPGFIPANNESHPFFRGTYLGRWKVYEYPIPPGTWFHMTKNAWDQAADQQTTEPLVIWLNLKQSTPEVFSSPPLNNIGEVDYLGRWIDPTLPNTIRLVTRSGICHRCNRRIYQNAYEDTVTGVINPEYNERGLWCNSMCCLYWFKPENLITEYGEVGAT